MDSAGNVDFWAGGQMIITIMTHFRTPVKTKTTPKSKTGTPSKSSQQKSAMKTPVKSVKIKTEKITPSRIQPVRQKDAYFSQAWKDSFEAERLILRSYLVI